MSRMIAVCGLKNSGKTTLVNKLIEALRRDGLKVAVIKHDGHDFDCDVPGTDTWQFAQSGADGVACFSGNRLFVHRPYEGESYEALALLFPDADVILVEGAKDSSLPKIEIVRQGISKQPVSNPTGRFLIATDLPDIAFQEHTADLNNPESIAQSIENELNKQDKSLRFKLKFQYPA